MMDLTEFTTAVKSSYDQWKPTVETFNWYNYERHVEGGAEKLKEACENFSDLSDKDVYNKYLKIYNSLVSDLETTHDESRVVKTMAYRKEQARRSLLKYDGPGLYDITEYMHNLWRDKASFEQFKSEREVLKETVEQKAKKVQSQLDIVYSALDECDLKDMEWYKEHHEYFKMRVGELSAECAQLREDKRYAENQLNIRDGRIRRNTMFRRHVSDRIEGYEEVMLKCKTCIKAFQTLDNDSKQDGIWRCPMPLAPFFETQFYDESNKPFYYSQNGPLRTENLRTKFNSYLYVRYELPPWPADSGTMENPRKRTRSCLDTLYGQRD